MTLVVLVSLIGASAASAGNGKVLILESTVSGGASSLEAKAAIAAGEGVELVNSAQWEAMTTTQFAAYDAVILGDPTCAGNTERIAAPSADAATWNAAIGGKVIIIGTDPVYHSGSQPGAVTLINKGVAFAVSDKSATGAYIDLSCYYASAGAATPVPMLADLSSFGGFTVFGQFLFSSCPANSHIVASSPALEGLTDAALSNWSCSAHEAFEEWPADFQVLAINSDIGKNYTASDGTVGGPYILARGATVISNISLTPLTATNPVGTLHTVTATAKENGSPVVGTTVTFTVIAGPNTGVTGTGTTNSNGEATFTYTSTLAGTDVIHATYVDSLGRTETSNTVEKIWEASVTDPAITASGTTVSATEGAGFSGTVATFSDPNTSATAGEYAATIEWGDGSSSTGTVSGSGGSFAVSGEHTYADEGNYTITVTITDVDNSLNSATATSSASVADAALTASGVSPTPVSPQSFAGTVASFTDANASSTAADFTATIEWGDGGSSTGTVSGSGGSYGVSGSHTYAGTGYFTIKVHIVDDGGSTADATTKVLIFGSAKGGSFVIGDNNAATGTAVTFWGAQWWKANSLSGGSGPASFKGFEDNPAAASCGQSWTTDPGNSTPPPAGPLPAYMEVVVSSKVSQSGSAISGNTPHLVVVKTNGGYAPNPGHAGTGTVIAKVC